MRRYETIIITPERISSEQNAKIVDNLGASIEKAGGKIIKTEDWGLRTMAFHVKKFRRGYYTLYDYMAVGDTVNKVEKACKLIEEIILFQSVKVEEEVDPAKVEILGKVTKHEARPDTAEGGVYSAEGRDDMESPEGAAADGVENGDVNGADVESGETDETK
jgi:small subunit ribosomal protein S6